MQETIQCNQGKHVTSLNDAKFWCSNCRKRMITMDGSRLFRKYISRESLRELHGYGILPEEILFGLRQNRGLVYRALPRLIWSPISLP